MKNAKIISCLVSFSLTACAVGPDFVRPDVRAVTTSHFIESSSVAAQTEGMSLWWQQFEDDALNIAVEHLLHQNLNIKQAGMRVLQAEESMNVASSSFLPTLGVTGEARRSGTPNSATGQRIYSNSLSATGALSWQVDVFGKVRRSVESAFSTFKASEYEAEAVVHSLVAEVVSLRIQIAAAKRQMYLAEEAKNNQSRVLELLERRYELGVSEVSYSDVLLAKSAVQNAIADEHSAQRTLKTLLYSYDVLLGEPIGTSLSENIDFDLEASPEIFAIGAPVSLLDRRPDLRASELRLKAANAEIGVAVGDLYPDLTIGGSLGFTATEFSKLFRSEQLAGSLFTSLSQRVFEGGRLRAQIRLREAQAEELIYAYTETVLNAFKEVETALMAETELLKERAAVAKSFESLSQTEDIYYSRYSEGVITLKTYLDVQANRIAAGQRYINLLSNVWQQRVALYLALGGDWFEGGDAAEDSPVDESEEDLDKKSMYMVMTMKGKRADERG